jgi:TolB protein
MKKFYLALSLLAAASSFAQHGTAPVADSVHYAEEKHFKNIQQLTFGGDNAEAYWSFDSKYIIFQ